MGRNLRRDDGRAMISVTAPSTADIIPLQPKPQPERFVMLRYSLLDSSAWQSLPPIAQALYLKMARKYNGFNNGRISYSRREGATALGVGKSTISRTQALLERARVIRRTSCGLFDPQTRKTKPSEWELIGHGGPPMDPGPPASPEEGSTTGTKRRIDKERILDGKKEASGLPREEGKKKKIAFGFGTTPPNGT